jgi:hypothetical protein
MPWQRRIRPSQKYESAWVGFKLQHFVQLSGCFADFIEPDKDNEFPGGEQYH